MIRLVGGVILALAFLVSACTPATSGTPSADAFLACTRQIESGGNYGVDSPGGTYHGAYQFLQSTWNSVAQHVERPDLVGRDPHTASVSDQDALAYALYQWQGKAPWGGRC